MGKFSAYKVQLAQLPDGHYEQDFVCDTEFFKNMEHTGIHNADIKVHMNLEKKNDVYDCTFDCKGILQVPCDRCLDLMDIEVDTQYHILVKYGETYNDESDDILVIPYSNPYLNVAYMLYDTIVLCIPLRCVHPLGKCNRAMAAALNKHKARGQEDEVDDFDLDLDSIADTAVGDLD